MLNFQYIYFLAAFACFIQVADSIDENKVDQSLTCDGEKLSISCLDVAPIGQKCFIRNISMGRACYTPDENDQVKKRCQGHGSCNIPAEHNVVGDTCYGTNKTMKVYCICYKAEYTLSTLITCEGERMYVSCPVTERIRIKYANYGRYDKETCHRSTKVKDQACFSEDAEYQVKKRCEGHQACNVSANSQVFGDPCFGTFKYLDVKYICEKAEPCTVELCIKNGGNCSESGCRCETGVSGKTCLILPVYIGCFVDRHRRTMHEDDWDSTSMTVESCTRFCHSFGHKYAALQHRTQCYCGDGNYDKYGESKMCTMPCGGNDKEICGGGWGNAVYSLVAEPCTLELCIKNGGTCSDSGCRCELGVSGKACLRVLPDYIGCFEERDSRAIDERFYAFGAMSVEWCTRWCHYKGHKYAALQSGNGCYCGDGGYDKYGESKNCTIPCIGDYTQVCGGSMTNSVYNVSGTQPVKP